MLTFNDINKSQIFQKLCHIALSAFSVVQSKLQSDRVSDMSKNCEWSVTEIINKLLSFVRESLPTIFK